MFDIGFSELLLVLVIGLVVLGPERLPVAVRTVSGWIRALRSLAASVQNELSQELKLQELQDSLKKVEKAGMQNLSPELKASMDELKDAAESLKRSYQGDSDNKTEPAHTIHNPLVTDPEAIHDGVTPAEAAAVASSPAAVPEPVVAVAPPVAQPVVEPVKQPVASAAQAKPEPVVDKTPASHQPSGDR
ncbi:Sec-independent protein translocase subunit TatB [Serratia proteamaculans]|uniref:Sec-independent protein translocase protein TatB n=1 Tax=Serratia TaxID=613 RepID=UPI00157651DC|nr:Sec-independent protein translocase protein TatB [Serratia quinivorans]NTX80892.1 Sec-independent protein translocase subunit TatB [Serratia proteamaculans]NTZ30094.1 Sec-independent protein translocase subunit TatB [Serratia proteamaculans]CAI1158918.1 Sec-independent protein translocase protein TatB [Serratia quinivorans]